MGAFFNKYQFLLFLLIGCLNTLFGYGVFCVFIWAGCHYAIAILLATFFGIFFNFKTIGTLVFKNRDNRLIVRFFLVYVVLYCLNIVIIHSEALMINNMYLRGLIAIMLTSILSYFLNKKLVFNSYGRVA